MVKGQNSRMMSFQLDAEDRLSIKRLAVELDVSASEVLRRAIKQFMATMGGEDARSNGQTEDQAGK